jgi:hypothetical protein
MMFNRPKRRSFEEKRERMQAGFWLTEGLNGKIPVLGFN